MRTLTLVVDADGTLNAEMGTNACSMRNSSCRAMHSAEAALGPPLTAADAMILIILLSTPLRTYDGPLE
jgi:hypothetical protein